MTQQIPEICCEYCGWYGMIKDYKAHGDRCPKCDSKEYENITQTWLDRYIELED